MGNNTKVRLDIREGYSYETGKDSESYASKVYFLDTDNYERVDEIEEMMELER